MSHVPQLLEVAGLDERQRKLIHNLADGMKPDVAADDAGYAPHYGAIAAKAAWVSNALHLEIGRRIRTEGAALGWNVLKSLAGDAAISAGVRAKCAVALLDRAGFVAPKADIAKPSEKDLTEMSPSELLDVIGKAEIVLSSRAKDVSAPLAAPQPSQATDIFD